MSRMEERDDKKFRELREEYKFLYRWQRRSLFEMAIAVGFICLIIGFMAGAAWHWKRSAGSHPVIVIEPRIETECPRGQFEV
jgi:hypothetical protein